MANPIRIEIPHAGAVIGPGSAISVGGDVTGKGPPEPTMIESVTVGRCYSGRQNR